MEESGIREPLRNVSEYATLYRQLYHISKRPIETVMQFATRVCSKVSAIRSAYSGGIPDAQVDSVKQKCFYGRLMAHVWTKRGQLEGGKFTYDEILI